MAHNTKARVYLGLLREDAGVTGRSFVHHDKFAKERPAQKGPLHKISALSVGIKALRVVIAQEFAPLHFILLLELFHAQQKVIVIDVYRLEDHFTVGDFTNLAAHWIYRLSCSGQSAIGREVFNGLDAVSRIKLLP